MYAKEQCESELKDIRRHRQKRKIIDFSIYGGYKWSMPILYEYDSAVSKYKDQNEMFWYHLACDFASE